MTTSSGRKGVCLRCGHPYNEHTEVKHSRCKRCKKVFDICQATVHGYGDIEGFAGTGRRICDVPCRCGYEFYPDDAKLGTPLLPHEYDTRHPGFRPLEEPLQGSTDSTIHDSTMYDSTMPTIDETIGTGGGSTYDGVDRAIDYDVTGLGSAMGDLSLTYDTSAVGPSSLGTKKVDMKGVVGQEGMETGHEEWVSVETFINKRGELCFKNDKGQEIKTSRREWQETLAENGTVEAYWWQSKKSLRWFATYELAEAEVVSPKKKRGKK